MDHEHILLLGEIKGKLDRVLENQGETNERLGGLDSRLRKVETRSAITGAVAGGIVSVGVALMIEKGKRTIGL